MKKLFDNIFLAQDVWYLRWIWNSVVRDVVLMLIKHLPIHNKRIIFFNRTGEVFGCNPAAIIEEILSHSEYSDFQPWFVVNEHCSADELYKIPEGCGIVKYTSLPYYYIYNTSRFIVMNVMQKYAMDKRSEQICIQTGHGGHGIKCFYLDNIDYIGEQGVKLITEETKKIDLILSDSEYFTSIVRSAYGYKGEVLEKGFPRNSLFFDTQRKHKSPNEPRYLLYAPTYRNDSRSDAYGFDVDKVIKALEFRFGGTWYIRISSHPLMRKFYRELYDFSNPRLIDVGTQDIQQFLLTSDALVTDYSSASMDFSLLDVANIDDVERVAHPVFLLIKDRSIDETKFYIEPQNLPFLYAETDEQLVYNILNFNEAEYLNCLDIFNYDTIKLKEQGHSFEHVLDWMKRQ